MPTRLTSSRPSRATITTLPIGGLPLRPGSPPGPAGSTRSRSPGRRAGSIERSATSATQIRPGRSVTAVRYAFDAANVAANASVAATSSAAAAASTFCLFLEASFRSFQTWSCRSGNLAKCSGLK